MSISPAGQQAIALPWLRPSTEVMLAITDDPVDVRRVAIDIPALAFALRFSRPTPSLSDFQLSPGWLSQPGLCLALADYLRNDHDLPAPIVPPLLTRHIENAVQTASELTLSTAPSLQDAVTSTVRLAYLGWIALSQVTPELTNDYFNQADPVVDPLVKQSQFWGTTPSAVTRRLAERWRLPKWITTVISYLHLQTEDAHKLGADPTLFRLVQCSISALETQHFSLGLTCSNSMLQGDRLYQRALSFIPLQVVPQPIDSVESETPSDDILIRLLRRTAQARTRSASYWYEEAANRNELLTDTLIALRSEMAEKLRDSKLKSLAEFAAGACHEINNPLAVIAGHTQMLLAKETDSSRQKQLQIVLRQTKRVNELLHGTLLFARPPAPKLVPLRIAEWVHAVASEYYAEAEAKGVALLVEPCFSNDVVNVDRSQMTRALGHLIQNALEASVATGTIVIGVAANPNYQVVFVEDSGPGPDPDHVQSLFDPFFSGRDAGRGTGLGLSICWSLAKVNHGDVRYRPTEAGRTRFELLIPRLIRQPHSYEKQSA